MEAFCFKCRGKHELLNPRPIFFENGSPATQGTCSNCGNEKVFKMGRTPEHEGLTPPERKPREPKPKAEKAPSKRTAKGKQAATSAKKAEGKKALAIKAGHHGSAPLVIVESPTKAKTIGKFLGSKYRVKASVGHIRDLPKSRLGVDVDNDFAPTYIVPMAKKATVKELKQIAANASSFWLATDPDREGEAISWHLKEALADQIGDKPVHRVEFHEITKEAIDHAFANPRQIDGNQVNAQQARRILDRLVGYKLSPLLSDKLSMRGLSAGRVQSVALRLVVDREREIQAFVPVEYWTIEAELEKQDKQSRSFRAKLYKLRGQDPDLGNEADASQVVRELEGAAYRVENVETRPQQRRPTAPFTTSTMQQEASRKLGFNARRTMGAAQGLYEGVDVGEGTVGLITYMRTDSVNVAESAQAEARQFITERYGAEFMPDAPPKYTSRAKNAQLAHEAIRPTSAFRTPEMLKNFLEPDQLKLYDLIWRRFVASQMANAVFDVTRVDIDAHPTAASSAQVYQPLALYWFRVSGSVVKFSGFLRVYEESHDEGDKLDETEQAEQDKRLPEMSALELLDLIQLHADQHFTQPPPRYTEASLVKVMEEFGIGRPSTYATIMTTIQTRNYVRRQGKTLFPTELGFKANDMLVGNFARYIDVGFTAHIEDELDDVETGAREWAPVLHEFFDPFRKAVELAATTIPKAEKVLELTGEMCPDCGHPLAYRTGRFGKFIGCTNFPACKHIEPIALPGVRCPKCGGKLAEKRAKKGGRVFYGCTNYPNCDFTTWSRPIPMACPTGDGGLMVEAGKGKAKCLHCEQTFEIPQDEPAQLPSG
ncbi:MAG TPA: type I DNA topoisomerase [Thermoflexales bacterium]|nr:type I DNA topoisomerase [Thermoflexales bacterium]